MPVRYWTGMLQPAKSTIFPPWLACQSWSTVLLSGSLMRGLLGVVSPARFQVQGVRARAARWSWTVPAPRFGPPGTCRAWTAGARIDRFHGLPVPSSCHRGRSCAERSARISVSHRVTVARPSSFHRAATVIGSPPPRSSSRSRSSRERTSTRPPLHISTARTGAPCARASAASGAGTLPRSHSVAMRGSARGKSIIWQRLRIVGSNRA